MINEKIAQAVINSIENEYQLDIHSNNLLKNRFITFRPYTQKKPSFYLCLLSRIKALFVLFFSFCFPLFSVFIRVKYTKQSSSDELAFICSEKGEQLLISGNKSINIISTLRQSSGTRIKLPTKLYFTYLYIIAKFFVRYRKDIWFYPQLLLIPELVATSNFLVKNRPSKVFICNHYDRWAYLFSFFAELEYYKLELTQHGVVTKEFKPKRKLKKVHKLICFDNIQLGIFDQYIIDKNDEFDIKKPLINLTAINQILSFLIVGHGNDNIVSLECEVIKKICESVKSENFVIYVKPHPAFDKLKFYMKLVNKKVDIISKKDFFPKVNYVLHSGSTLAKEYEYSDSEVFTVDITSSEQLNLLLKRITD
ncbi:MAG: hypothetical protein COB48_06390 [Pseudoalteromonas sp.]|nr:MAG: hypothetical protein COB48_06390 [Pseudoalteromonas sp.]